MSLIILASITFWFVSSCEGLALTFKPESSVLCDANRACSILACSESADNATSADPENDLSSIWSFRVLKTAKETNRSVELAKMTAQNPRITRVSNGVKIQGWLKAREASLRIEFFKNNDYSNIYKCEVQGMNNHGKQIEKSASLAQQPVQNENTICETISTSAAPLQVLVIIQQFVAQSLRNVEDKITDMKRDVTNEQIRLESRVEKISNGFYEKIDSFQRLIEDKLHQVENRIEDKIDNDNLNKLTKLDSKLSMEISQFRSEIKPAIIGSLQNLTDMVLKNQEQFIASVYEKLETSSSNAADFISFEERKCNYEQDFLAIRNETEFIRKLSASEEIFSHQLQRDVQKLASSFENYTTIAQAELRHVLSYSESTEQLDLRSALNDILTPKFCRKGMVFALAHSPSPYMVIHPNETNDSGIDFPHLCDVTTDGGGWVVIQRRVKGNVDFNRNWTDYKQGFGFLDHDFWLGNDKIHAITRTGVYELKVDLRDVDKPAYAHYSHFHIAGENENYKLKVGAYDGTAGDSLNYHNGRPFSTMDRDNDAWDKNCAAVQNGGWWFGACDHSNLNGKWGAEKDRGVEWEKFTATRSVSFAEMKIRRI